ncbi:ubiquinone/menaquinone biosynthesis C-methyltransferase UbiE [Methanobrevibacter curvatus]|uniref:Ubiquinone/menaquinone biosynthesis C-methyltransferase UbiE n=2 Tax=Methanobrevibacter curvatus TaxID=49547 RepID=A0A166ALI0_9EURY|nr:ubiquinone/menaquinone biosynthesis C-methyltransferase UbiE [Methanobrevibacter curvatus]
MQDIPYPDNTFDLIYNSHVLEHVPDDIKAMNELYRVVKPYNGKIVIMVPILKEETLEKEEYNTPELRSKYYGQFDHLRAYGKDFSERLKSVGFNVEVVSKDNLINKDEIKKHGRINDEIYVCTKTE